MTADPRDHDELRESAGLYVLGALDRQEREAFELHLATCRACADEVRSLASVAQSLPHAVPIIDPPADLRSRVLAHATDSPSIAKVIAMPAKSAPRATRGSGSGWMAAAAMLLISVAAGGYAWTLRDQVVLLRGQLSEAIARLDRSEAQVAVATRAVNVAEARMAVLTASDMRQVNLAGQPVSPQASGRAFLSRSRGLLFTATSLPPLPAGRSYQLWIVTAAAPVSIGLLEPDNTGRVAQAFETPAGTEAPVAVAVTMEPEGGVPAPTGDKYLVGLTE
jgi:anti-sigma-K factor RskA